jgi:hypothetical protein
MLDINGNTIAEGKFIKITGCKVKNDNGIYIVDKQYDGKDDFCLHKVLISGALSKTKYNIFFLNERVLAKDDRIIVEVVKKEQLKQAAAEIKSYVNSVTAKEKVYTFTPGDVNSRYIKIIKPIHFRRRIYGLTGTYELKRGNDKVCLHLIGAKGEIVSPNINNRYKESDILLSLDTTAFNRLVSDGNIAFFDRQESAKGKL